LPGLAGGGGGFAPGPAKPWAETVVTANSDTKQTMKKNRYVFMYSSFAKHPTQNIPGNARFLYGAILISDECILK
jgi:hypothetical protein